jgi:branched-chain amino acid transport system ATP-binding protein
MTDLLSEHEHPSGSGVPDSDVGAGESLPPRVVAPMTGGERARRQVRVNFASIKADLLGVTALRKTKYGITPVLVLAIMGFFQGFDTSIFGLLLPEIRTELGISVKTLGDISSVTGFCGLAFAPLFGYLTDRRNRARMLGFSAILSGVFSLLTARARGNVQLFGARVLDDLGENFGRTPEQTLLFDYYPVESRGKMLAFLGTMGRLASLVVGPAVGALAVLGGWRLPFYVAGPLLMLSGVLGLKVLKEPIRGYWERRYLGAGDDVAEDPEPPVRIGEAVRGILAIRTLRRNLASLVVSTVFTTAFAFIFQFFLVEKFHLNAFQRSLLGVPSTVTGILGIMVGGAITDIIIRYRPSRLLVAQALIGLLGCSALLIQILSPSILLLIIFSLVFSFTGGLVLPASSVIAGQVLPPRLRGFGISIVLTGVGIVALIGGPLAGRLMTAYGTQRSLLYLFPLTLLPPLISLSAAKFFELDMRAAFASTMAKEDYRRAKAAGTTKLLVCRDVDINYGSVQVLFNVDFVVEEGEIVALLGTNGAGKSTLLRAISGTQEASNGAILFDGRDITHLPPNDISKLGVITMPGGKGVFPGLSVQENLALALWRCPEEEQEARLEQVFGFFPALRPRLAQDAASLSGGEQQMVALGQAFLSRPRLLMIDELSLGLSPAVVGELLDIVQAIHDQGATIILVEQSVNVALTLASRAVFMEKGEVRFEGPTSDLITRPDLLRAVYVRGAGRLGNAVAGRRSQTRGRPLLEVRNLTKRYGGKVAVDNVSLTLHEGEALGLIGPNGAGKTTLFDLISGYQRADEGTVVLDGVDLSKMSADARARARLIRRFQDARLFPSLTVYETICVALERRLEVRNTFLIAGQLPASRRSERRARAAADRLIDLFDLGSYRDKFVADLSTGLRRVVDVACVLAAEPRVLLLDEPSSGIAQAEAESLGPLLRRVRHETGCSLLIIEHDMPLIRSVSDELVGLVQGQVVVQGLADAVLSHPTIVSAYLGDRTDVIERQGDLS